MAGPMDIESFFERHRQDVLTFEVKIGGQVERVDFAKEFILGERRTDPFAIQKRLDYGSSMVAFYGTLYNAAKRRLKDANQDYEQWYAAEYKLMQQLLIAETAQREMAAGLKKAPTGQEVEYAVAMFHKTKDVYAAKKKVIAEAEQAVDNMKLLFDCAKIDTDLTKSCAYLEDTMISKGLLEVGPRQVSPQAATTRPKEKPLPTSDGDF